MDFSDDRQETYPGRTEGKISTRTYLQEMMFHGTATEEYLIHFILGDATYCKIRMDGESVGRSTGGFYLKR